VGNCPAKICPSRQGGIPALTPVTVVAQTESGPGRPPSPAAPVLSASAQTRWRQICNQPLKNKLDTRELLMPGTRLDFSVEERTRIGHALAQLPSGAQFWPTVVTACNLGNPVKFAAVETLIRHGLLDPNQITDGNTLLQTVCRYGENAWPRLENPLTLEHRINSLIALGAHIETPDLPAIALLQQTWERNDTDSHLAAAALIANGCNPLQRDELGRNLLHRAAQEGNVPVLRGWQQAGLRMQIPDFRLDTALHHAAHSGHPDAVRFLVTEGRLDINARGWENQTALFNAVNNSHLETARTLLELQANPRLANDLGRSPLLMAVATGSEPMRALLVQHGADPHATSTHNWEFPTAASLYQHLHGQPWPNDA
jgi:ankyrin repeat protein